MSVRSLLLATTAIVSTATVWTAPAAQAADLVKALPVEQALPAVSAPNFKISGFAGTGDARDDHVDYGKSLYGGQASFTAPLGRSWGAQVDGLVGSWGGDTFAGGAGHLFWRDPSRGMFGIDASALWFDRGPWFYLGKGSGLTMAQVGPEFEVYWKDWTFRGIAGWAGGDIPDSGFAKLDVVWYPVQDFMLSVGYRNTFNQSALALGAEYLLPQSTGMGRVSLFAEGRFGNESNRAAIAGLRVYFGPSKTLIDKHRRDDPHDWSNDNIFALQKLASQFNRENEIAKCAITSCIPSDYRVKRDISRVGEFANGIGLYRYRYLWSDIEYVGVMAQELLARIPEAVVRGADGYLRVDYGLLGLRLSTWKEWLRRPEIA